MKSIESAEQQFLNKINQYVEDVKKYMYPQRLASWKIYVGKALDSKKDLIILNNMKKAILLLANKASESEIVETLRNGIDSEILFQTELVKLAYYAKTGIDLYCSNIKMNDIRQVFAERIRKENAQFEEELCDDKTM
ncbi:MAG: hypothetical protein WCX32_01620 [Clostridia bacterium]|jgi:hypothetical protein|nr:hypothetical protein [Clostridia bacterium]